MARPRFVIEALEAEAMAKQADLAAVVDLLPSLVKSAQSLARVPISKFHVGAVGFGSSGRIFFGVNLEFPSLPLSYSVHAEQFLVTNLSLNAEPRLAFVAVSAAPCGHCRQFFQEIRRAQDIQILITDDENDTSFSSAENDASYEKSDASYSPLRSLLPRRFGPEDLLGDDAPLVLEKHDNSLSLIEADVAVSDDDDELASHALEAANRSHAPYSECPSGVAIADKDGNVYRGWYMESAAYNPSMGPVRAALVDFIVSGGREYEDIVAAVLVEKERALVKQEQTARLLLQTISPKAEFRVLHCK